MFWESIVFGQEDVSWIKWNYNAKPDTHPIDARLLELEESGVILTSTHYMHTTLYSWIPFLDHALWLLYKPSETGKKRLAITTAVIVFTTTLLILCILQ
jgi:hypothetical protein